MGHGIEKDDTQFYVKQAAWHGLGTVLDTDPKTSLEALTLAGLDWKVEKVPVCLESGEKISDYFATVRSTDQKPLGVVGRRYTALQNVEAFEFFDPLIENKVAKYETAGSLRGGKKVWILAKLGSPIELSKDDKIEKYVLLSNTHDGTGTVTAIVTPVRVVCWNTLSAALYSTKKTAAKDLKDAVKIRHTKSVKDRTAVASELLESVTKLYDELGIIWAGMKSFKLVPLQIEEYLHKVIPDTEGVDNPHRTAKQRMDILQLAANGMGTDLADVKGTLWGMYNAVTEYADHMQSLRKGSSPDKHLDSVWFGPRHDLKERAFEVAIDTMNS